MTLSRPFQMALYGAVLLLIVQIVLSLLDRRAAGELRLHTALHNQAEIQALSQEYTKLSNAKILSMTAQPKILTTQPKILTIQHGEKAELFAGEKADISAKTDTSAGEKPDLFALVNNQAEKLHLSRYIEAARPSTESVKVGTNATQLGTKVAQTQAKSSQTRQILELRMVGLNLNQCVDWLYTLESLPDLRIESLNLRRTAQGLLNLDLRLSLGTTQLSH